MQVLFALGLFFAISLAGCEKLSSNQSAPPAEQPLRYSPLAPDLPGPDGLIYPNFSFAGLPDDVKYPERVLELSDFGAKPGENVAPALRAALERAKSLGGAVIEFGHGTYFLDEPILINTPNIVLRGKGRGGPGYFATTLIFRFAPQPKSVQFFFVRDGDTIHPEGCIGIVADPGLTRDYWNWTSDGRSRQNPDISRQLAKLELYLDGKLIREADTIKDHHFAPQTALLTAPLTLRHAEFKDGTTGTFRAIARWNDGTERTAEIRLKADASLPDSTRGQGDYAIFSFAGPDRFKEERFVELSPTQAIRRGDTVLNVESAKEFSPGDYIRIHTRKKPDFIPFGSRYFHGFFRVTKTTATEIHLDRPVRMDVPLEADPRIRKQSPLRNVGVEAMTIRQESDTWIHGIAMRNVWGAWVRDVELVNIGRCPVYFSDSVQCEVRDVLMNGAQYDQAGGMSAYAGWFDNVYDSLMENVTTVRLRHAPNFQGQSAGNVVRNSTFENSDLQFHAFFPFENLVENCRVYATTGSGSSGYGLYTSKVHTQHGQIGPRNVIYGNDVRSPKEPVFFGGAESETILVHNRFAVIANSPFLGREPMPAIRMAEGSNKNLFQNNIFALAVPDAPIMVEGAPGHENRFIQNTFMNVNPGATEDIVAGWKSKWRENQMQDHIDHKIFSRWQHPPSLYLFQKQLVAGGAE